MKKYLFVFVIVSIFFSCEQKKQTPVYESVLDSYEEENIQNQEEVAVPFRCEGGVKYVKVSINGLGCDMIFDTGCSNALISVAEANYLYQKGKLSVDDIIGITQSQIADGSIVENMVVNLQEVIIDDKICCPNVQATVSNNINAPLLLGNEILDRVATITIDNEHNMLIFNIK